MRKPIRRNIHLGSGDEGQQRLERLEQIAANLDLDPQHGTGLSKMNQMIADCELEVTMGIKKGERVAVYSVNGTVNGDIGTVMDIGWDGGQKQPWYEVEFEKPVLRDETWPLKRGTFLRSEVARANNTG